MLAVIKINNAYCFFCKTTIFYNLIYFVLYQLFMQSDCSLHKRLSLVDSFTSLFQVFAFLLRQSSFLRGFLWLHTLLVFWQAGRMNADHQHTTVGNIF